MYARSLAKPGTSFFLFGPRATGKTTWLRENFPNAAWLDLLHAPTALEYTRRPERLGSLAEAQTPGAWIVIDEVQRVPALLDEVHRLLTAVSPQWNFALSGSSARKLRRGGANMLAGRAITRQMFPLTGAEMNFEFDVESLLRFGCLPRVRNEPTIARDILEAYAGTYLQEEIRQEAAVRDLGSFSRFLEVAAIANGQPTNLAGIARDAGVARTTVERYFEVLVDTLIGSWLPAWRPRARVKEVGRPKFYLFDTGVARALSGTLAGSLLPEERGSLMETLVLSELRAHISYSGTGGSLGYWRTAAGLEVDFVWQSPTNAVAIEVKAGDRWRRNELAPLRELVEQGRVGRGFVVYGGTETLREGPILILPVKEFMMRLASGDLLVSEGSGE